MGNVQLEKFGKSDELLVCDGDQVVKGMVLFRPEFGEDVVVEVGGEVVMFKRVMAVVEK